MSWALPLIFLTHPWIFYTGNLPREASVTLLNTVSRGKKAIYHGKSAPCNRTYCISRKKPITPEKTRLQPVTLISLWFYIASDWMLYNGKCQNQSVQCFRIHTATKLIREVL